MKNLYSFAFLSLLMSMAYLLESKNESEKNSGAQPSATSSKQSGGASSSMIEQFAQAVQAIPGHPASGDRQARIDYKQAVAKAFELYEKIYKESDRGVMKSISDQEDAQMKKALEKLHGCKNFGMPWFGKKDPKPNAVRS